MKAASPPASASSPPVTDRADLRRAADQWQREGWVLVDGLAPPDDLAAAQADLASLDPSLQVSGSVSRPRYPRVPDEGPGFRAEQFVGTRLFPVRDAPALNRLFLSRGIADFARAALGEDDIRLYQSRLSSKYGDRTNYEQPMHQDLNHSLVPTRSEPGWWHLESFLYLCDVDESNGAILLVPRPHDEATDPPPARAVAPAAAPALYAEEIRVPASAGSLLAYRSDVWHRGADLEPGTERHVLILGYKPAGLEWIGYDVHPPLSINEDFIALAESCEPDQLALLGFPAPGHPYWTAELLAATAARYPNLDLEPWRAQLGPDERPSGA